MPFAEKTARPTAEAAQRQPVAAHADRSASSVSSPTLSPAAPGTLAHYQAMANQSPRMVAQQKQLQQLRSGGETAQRQAAPAVAPNRTGLPDGLKSGVESLSGLSMDHVRVHYNSAQPAQLNADAYAQGSDIHVAPGQERHLPHEAWHVVQQMQGRVRPTMQMKGGLAVNDDAALEREADVMGEGARLHKDSVRGMAVAEGAKINAEIPVTNAMPIQAQWVDQSGNALPQDLMELAQRSPLDALLQAGQRAGFPEEAEALQLRLEGLQNMGFNEQLMEVENLAKKHLVEHFPKPVGDLIKYILSALRIPDDSMDDAYHEEDSGPGNEEEEILPGDLQLSEIPTSDKLHIAEAFAKRHPDLAEQFATLAKVKVIDPSLFLEWYNSGVLTRNQFNLQLQSPRQFARTPGTLSYQAIYVTANLGIFKDVTYLRDNVGNIAFNAPKKVKAWSNPINPSTGVQLTDGSKTKTHGITLNGTKIKIAGASRSQHFSIANRILGNQCGSNSPDGWTWHHLTSHYKMIQVDRTVHAKHGHNGGVSVWK